MRRRRVRNLSREHQLSLKRQNLLETKKMREFVSKISFDCILKVLAHVHTSDSSARAQARAKASSHLGQLGRCGAVFEFTADHDEGPEAQLRLRARWVPK